MELKLTATCRRGYKIALPCNWNIKGACGADTHACTLIAIHKKEPLENINNFETVEVNAE